MSDSPPYQETRKRNLVPHFVGVPIREGVNAVCVALWQSRRTRNLITLGISSVRLPPGEYPLNINSIDSLIDTGADVIRRGYWHLGPTTSLCIPPEVSMRTDVKQVWCNDEPIRSCSDRDDSVIPPLQLAGMGVVEDYIRFLDTDVDGSRYSVKNRAIMDTHLNNFPIEV